MRLCVRHWKSAFRAGISWRLVPERDALIWCQVCQTMTPDLPPHRPADKGSQ